MSLAGREIVEADPENWLISEGKLYLFGKSIGPDLFQKDLAANVARANQNRDLIPNIRAVSTALAAVIAIARIARQISGFFRRFLRLLSLRHPEPAVCWPASMKLRIWARKVPRANQGEPL